MIKFLLIGLAGAVGTWARYLISVTFPSPTLIVNIVGSFLICFIVSLTASTNLIPKETSSVLVVGLLGGFTTYSAFTYETIALVQSGEPFKALAYTALMLFACLAAGGLGLLLATSFK